MKAYKLAVVSVFALALAASGALAMKHTPEGRGKALFNDPKLSGGTSGNSCNTCHPNGKGLEGAGMKNEWSTPGGKHKTLEEAINMCITMALKGKPLDVKSGEMKDLVAYIKSLKAAGSEAPKKKKPAMGC